MSLFTIIVLAVVFLVLVFVAVIHYISVIGNKLKEIDLLTSELDEKQEAEN